jgi:hypothetical protein
MGLPFTFNKYTALVIVLIFLIICYYISTHKKGSSKKTKSGGRAKNSKKSKSNPKTKRSRQGDDGAIEDLESEPEPEDEPDEEKSDDDNINKDAEELYNIAHEALCNGIKNEEFEELVGDLASTSTFIELKQLYNQCIQKKLDPSSTIKIEDYIKILREEDT